MVDNQRIRDGGKFGRMGSKGCAATIAVLHCGCSRRRTALQHTFGLRETRAPAVPLRVDLFSGRSRDRAGVCPAARPDVWRAAGGGLLRFHTVILTDMVVQIVRASQKFEMRCRPKRIFVLRHGQVLAALSQTDLEPPLPTFTPRSHRLVRSGDSACAVQSPSTSNCVLAGWSYECVKDSQWRRSGMVDARRTRVSSQRAWSTQG